MVHTKTFRPNTFRRHEKKLSAGDTGQEALYLRSLSDRQIVVDLHLHDGETVQGWIEYFDESMIRLTREGKPNLFIYKQQISTLREVVRRRIRPSIPGRSESGN